MKSKRKFALHVLSPYGEWPHHKGMQIVDKAAAQSMSKNFSSLSGRLLGRKCPIFFGHPDNAPGGVGKPVGRVEGLQVLEDGIAALCSYEEGAFEKITTGKIKSMSPRWQMKRLENGMFRPVKLISIGLTNNPNITGSGRLLSISLAPDSECGGENGELNEKALLECANSINGCREKVERLKASSETLIEKARLGCAIERRALAKSPREKPELSPIPRGSAKLAEIAKEKMRRTGLPYTKCFAMARRESLQ